MLLFGYCFHEEKSCMNPGIRIKLSFNFTDWLEFVQFVYPKLNISLLNKHQKIEPFTKLRQ